MKRYGATFAVLVLLLAAKYSLGSAAKSVAPTNQIILIEGMKFTPNVIRVHPGDSVEFRNSDYVPHTVTERSGQGFDSGPLTQGKSWKFVAGSEGEVRYHCLYHPDMIGTIIVGNGMQTSSDRTTASVEKCGIP